ncbi:MAG: PQQ-like beta-propeller repeat protein [Deltaproteobacteria bacterium]|nr:PQQ-like beta-propeller repeat protein [Deltaproteobacteria bacterium]
MNPLLACAAILVAIIEGCSRTTLPIEEVETASVEDDAGSVETAAPPRGPIPGDAWLQVGHDARHTARSTASPARNPRRRHTIAVALDEWLIPVLVIDELSRPYVASADSVRAFDSSGAIRWTREVPKVAGVALMGERTVIATTRDGLLYRFDRDGRELGSVVVRTGTHNASAPVIAHDNVFVTYHQDTEWYVCAADSWCTAVGRGASLPTIAPDGTVWVAAGDGLTRLSAKGELLPRLHHFPLHAVVLADDGTPRIVVEDSSRGYGVVGIREDGERTFEFFLHKVIAQPPVVAADGVAYVPSAGGPFAVRSDGTLVWTVEAKTRPSRDFHAWEWMALAGDGTLIVTDETPALHGVLDGRVLYTLPRSGAPLEAGAYNGRVAIAPDGTIYATGPASWKDRVAYIDVYW